MSTVNESVKEVSKPRPQIKRPSPPILNRVLNFLSSVRFGVVLLCVLVVLALLGMLIIQQNVPGFDAFYAGLTPAEKTVYGTLGFFDIYYSWYFKLILLTLSLNIILASIDRFPSAWSYIVKPKLTATKKWLLAHKLNAEIGLYADDEQKLANEISRVFKKQGLKTKIAEKEGNLYVFGESGKWNRLGAYIVHVALLTLFLGHFVALQTGFDADVNFMPGQTTSEIQLIEFNLDEVNRFAVKLPFTITATDIQQKLIDPNGSIEVFNTLDWLTRIKIDDPEYGVSYANVSLNNPFNYRGYRFFQAQTVPIGNARTMTLEITPEESGAKPLLVDLSRVQEVKLPNGTTQVRSGSATLEDGTLIEYDSFLADFVFNRDGNPDTKTGEYNNPAVVLQVTPKSGERTRVFAFAGDFADKIPVGAPKLGYKWRLKSYEKSPLAHVLSIKYDPFNGAFIAWYFGGIGLIFALSFVFFLSHKRIWALIEKEEFSEKFNVVLGGHTNRNHFGFEDKFKKVVKELSSS